MSERLPFIERVRLAYLDAVAFDERQLALTRRPEERNRLLDDWHRHVMHAEHLSRLT